MKTISLKKLHAFVVYQNLKRTPPKEFTDLDEMTVVVDVILPAFQAVSGKFLEFRKQSETLGNDLGTGRLTKEDWEEKVQALQKELRTFELSEGEQLSEVQIETSGYNKLEALFTKWGKNWFADLEDFMAVNKAIKGATDQPKA